MITLYYHPDRIEFQFIFEDDSPDEGYVFVSELDVTDNMSYIIPEEYAGLFGNTGYYCGMFDSFAISSKPYDGPSKEELSDNIFCPEIK